MLQGHMHPVQRPTSLLSDAHRPCSHSTRPCNQSRAIHNNVADLAAKGQVSFQETLVGGAVCVAIIAAVYLGTKGEPVVCTLCQGNGGARCFGCEGAGKIKAQPKNLQLEGSEDFTRRQDDLQKCNVCRGSGLVLCRQCKGTGFMKRF